MNYQYTSPAEWLVTVAKGWGEDKLYNTIRCLVDYIDSDDIQEIFEDEMNEDGYFEEKK